MTVEVLDLILIAILGYWAWRAARHGFVDESLSVVGLVLAVVAMIYFGPKAAETLRHSLHPAWIATLGGYGLVFLAVLLAATFITSWFSGKAKRSRMGPLDGILGAVFGVVKGMIVFALVFLALSFVVSPRHYPNWVTDARLYPVISKTADMVASLAPEADLRRHLAPARTDDKTPAAKTEVRATPDADEGPTPAPNTVVRGATPGKTEAKHRTSVDYDKTVTPIIRPKTAERATQKQHTAKQLKSSYGAKDREALDRLIEENGKGENGKP